MFTFTTVKNVFRAVAERRPVSHLAAVTLLGTSIYGVHEGAASVLPAGLVAATTAAMLGAEWLQWTALGRLSKLGDTLRAHVLQWQCAGIGLLQVLLYTLAVTNYAREAGMDWGSGWPMAGAIAIASLFAGLNFVAKWTSCEALEDHEEAAPAPLPKKPQPRPAGDNIYDLTRTQREIAGYGAERRDLARIFDEERNGTTSAKAERNRAYYERVTKPKRRAARRAATA